MSKGKLKLRNKRIMCDRKIENLSINSKYYTTVKRVDEMLDKDRRQNMTKFEDNLKKKAFELTNEEDIQYRTPEVRNFNFFKN